jgi:hypothetical protein
MVGRQCVGDVYAVTPRWRDRLRLDPQLASRRHGSLRVKRTMSWQRVPTELQALDMHLKIG